jgi:hypothetical protein
MSEFTHFGLYFGPDAVVRARDNAKHPPYQDAFAALASTSSPPHPIPGAVLAAFQYRFLADTSAAGRAASWLVERSAGIDQPATATYQATCAGLMAAGHAFEMIRETLPTGAQRDWLRSYSEQVTHTQNQAAEDASLDDLIWQTGLKIVAGVVLDRADMFQSGTGTFKRIIEQHIHPEGYLPAIVTHSTDGALFRQVLAAKGLALAAEAAAQQGLPLWGHEVRGISVKTAGIYAAAYYEYRDRWAWDAPPTQAENEQFYQENAAFLEMLNRHLRPEVLRSTLKLIRPLMDPYGGGMTTLTHADLARRSLFNFGG